MKPDLDDLKEDFKIWWEFLLLSKGYKEFCKIIDHDDFEAFMKFKKKYRYLINGPLKSITYELNYDLIWDYQNCDIEKGRLPGEIPLTYTKFGNIHNKTFDSFWEDTGSGLFDSSPIGIAEKSITKFINLLELYRCHYFDPVHNPNENNDAKEFINFIEGELLPEKAKQPSLIHNGVCVYIDMTKSQGEIIYDIKKLIAEYKVKDPIKMKTENNRWLRCQFRYPTPHYKWKEIKRYLRVLKLFDEEGLKGMTAYEKIPIEIVPPEYDFSNMYDDLSKARKILKNVEKGFFPGKYN